jgi:hypothetical protein
MFHWPPSLAVDSSRKATVRSVEVAVRGLDDRLEEVIGALELVPAAASVPSIAASLRGVSTDI